jgi:hypothetical protein
MDNPCLQKPAAAGEKSDARHERIQRALWWFVEHAPFNDILAQVILNTLARLNPEEVHVPDSIEATLNRWGQFGLRKASKAVSTLTGVSRQDELRCLIASLYGKKTGALSDAKETSRDVARRCCYYANARLTARQISAGYQRDAAVFLLAAAGNTDILLDREKSAALEQHLGDDWLTYRYLRIREALHRERRTGLADPVTHRLLAVVSSSRSRDIRAAREGTDTEARRRHRGIAESELIVASIDSLGKGMRSMAVWVLAALAAIAAVIWLR